MDPGYSYHKRLMEGSLLALKAASLRTGHIPTTKHSRAELFKIQQQLLSQSTSSIFNSKITYITHRFPPCVVPLSALEKIYAAELCLETNHRGSYIVLRTITRPARMAAVVSLVEDEVGGCEIIQLGVFNVELEENLDGILKAGQVLIVKEPFYKLNASGGLKVGMSICVEHISDIIYLGPGDSRIPAQWQTQQEGFEKTAEEWKEDGNAMLGDGGFSEAIECYTKGLETASKTPNSGEITKVLRLNRSQALLKLSESGSAGFHDEALADCDYVLGVDPGNEKALYRKAKVLYLARNFDACRSLLTTFVKAFPKNKEARADLLKVYHRLQEERTGKYDWQELRALTSNTKRDPIKLDCADFVGPICVKDIPGTGRGLVATRDVKFGELLLFIKAFHISYPQNGKPSVIIDLKTGQMHKDSGCDRWALEVIQNLYRNPSAFTEFLKLYGGPWNEERITPRLIDGKPIVDTFLVHDIRNINAFICPILSKATDSISLTQDPTDLKNSLLTDGLGVWILPSFMNHACWSAGSAQRSTIGDMMIVRATTPIKKGDQITIQYHNDPEVNTRRHSLHHSYHFVCKCDLCIVESLESPTTRNARQALLSKIMALETEFTVPDMIPNSQFEAVVGILPRTNELIKDLEATYSKPPTEQPRYVVVSALIFLGKVYDLIQRLGLNVTSKIVETGKHIFQSLGYVIRETPNKLLIVRYGHFADTINLSETLVRCSVAYRTAGNLQMAGAWQEMAIDFYEVTFGERISFFQMYRDILENAA